MLPIYQNQTQGRLLADLMFRKKKNSKISELQSKLSSLHPFQGLDNEQCRSCSSFSDYIKSTKKKIKEDERTNGGTSNGERREDCPLDKDELGHSTWGLLHTMAAKFPEKATKEEQKDMCDFFTLFSKFYPCDHCAKDLRDELKIEPPETKGQEALSQWLCRLHNKVNVKTGKDIFDCTKVNQRWRDGWLDGSCD